MASCAATARNGLTLALLAAAVPPPSHLLYCPCAVLYGTPDVLLAPQRAHGRPRSLWLACKHRCTALRLVRKHVCTARVPQVLKRAGLKYEKVYTHANNHAGYYPGASTIDFKLLFDPTSGTILGAQVGDLDIVIAIAGMHACVLCFSTLSHRYKLGWHARAASLGL